MGQVLPDHATPAGNPEDDGRTISRIDAGAKHASSDKQTIGVGDQGPDGFAGFFQLTGRSLKVTMINRQKEAVAIRLDQSAQTILHSPIHIQSSFYRKWSALVFLFRILHSAFRIPQFSPLGTHIITF
jgi:hypothetical protein